ncbi:MAG: antibiotic biosynthesis monooxygenase family protein [Cryomorphaceae bacterium]
MFIVLYKFVVHEGQEESFIEAWEGLTRLIYQFEGSLGSHLHLSTEHPLTYIAYAQWPDQTRWENSGNNLPEEANKWRGQMRDACALIETIHSLNSVKDLTETKIYN